MTIGTSNPGNLIAGDFYKVTDWLSIPSGILKRGTVLTSAGAAVAAAGDPYAVLAEDIDASGGAVVAPVYLTGEFNRALLTIASGAALTDAVAAKLRGLSIFAKATVKQQA